ncbi:MAG: cytochrome c, partial [Planctomycetota bacterium]
KVDGKLAQDLPMPLTSELLERGRERYQIFCTPCHDFTGSGRGMVVQRGFKQPQSFHQDRLRAAADGYFFDVMTGGFGAMFDYSARISPEDRWAITAHIRVLQRAWTGTESDVPPEILAELQKPEVGHVPLPGHALPGTSEEEGHGAQGGHSSHEGDSDQGDGDHEDSGHGDSGHADEEHEGSDH